MPNEEDRNDTMLSYLESIQDYYGTYHHHKEMMMWIAIGLSFPTLIGVGEMCDGSSHGRLLYLVLAIALLLGFVCFVVQQSSMKQVAADIVKACLGLRAKLLGGTLQLTDRDFEPKHIKSTDCRFPALLYDAVVDSLDAHKWNRRLLPHLKQLRRGMYCFFLISVVLIVMQFPDKQSRPENQSTTAESGVKLDRENSAAE